MMKRSAVFLLAVLAPVGLPQAQAVDLVSTHFALSLPPQETVTQELACPDEQLISGGYEIEDVGGGTPGDVTIMANARSPDAQGTWRVSLYNRGTGTLTVGLRISIMCD